MSEIFNFQRFWTYFKYDLKQMWRNHSKAAIVIGGSIAFRYVIWVLFSLVFTQTWTAPHIIARVAVFFIAYVVLIFYQTRTYGYLTEKKAGSAWLMIPASRTEKFVSMLLMTLIVIPVLFVAVFFLLDAFLSLVDPTYGQTLVGALFGNWDEIVKGFNSLNAESPLTFSLSAVIVMTVFSLFSNLLYFLLCGICFKKNKIVAAIAISFGLSFALSILNGIFIPLILKSPDGLVRITTDEVEGARFIAGLLNFTEILCILIVIGLAWGIWRRIKTIQH